MYTPFKYLSKNVSRKSTLTYLVIEYAKLSVATAIENKVKTLRILFIGKKQLNTQSAKVEASTVQHALPGEAIHLCEVLTDLFRSLPSQFRRASASINLFHRAGHDGH